jgi:hypothetical protein
MALEPPKAKPQVVAVLVFLGRALAERSKLTIRGWGAVAVVVVNQASQQLHRGGSLLLLGTVAYLAAAAEWQVQEATLIFFFVPVMAQVAQCALSGPAQLACSHRLTLAHRKEKSCW